MKVDKAVGGDRFTSLSHQMLVIRQVMKRQQNRAEHLIRFEKMAKIRPAHVRIWAR